jgi:tetratricopeptide (TPR) repeat protein
VRTTQPLSALIEVAQRRGFVGLALEGVDVEAAIAAADDAVVLGQALDVAARADENLWAERLARRLCACDASANARLRLGLILVSKGQLDEARAVIAAIPPKDRETDERYRRILGVLYAKTGDADEAMAIFDTLPGRLDGYYPAAAVLTAAQEMIAQCDIAHSLALVERLHAKYPAHLLIRGLLLRCHLYAGAFDKARGLARVSEAELAKAPAYDRRVFVAAAAEIFELMGWMNELFDFARDALGRDPTHWALYAVASNAAAFTSREKEYDAIVEVLPAASRDSAEAQSVLFRWHADANRIDEAAALLGDIRRQSASLFLNASLYLTSKGRDQADLEAAFDSCRRCGIGLLGAAIGYSLHVYYYNCSPDLLREALARLTPFLATERMRTILWQTYLRCLIGLGDVDAAADWYRALPAGLAQGTMLRPFHMFFEQRQGRHDQARGDWMAYIRATRHLCVNARSSYPRTLQLKYTETPGAVLLFLTVFNGADYIDWFLDHYRRLGVDHFFITDNASTDDTAARLVAQPDVSLFYNADSFARSGFGVHWTNHLAQRFAAGHWCIHVDMDEAFVFPGSDNGRSLHDLLAYCDDRGFGLVRAIALDMYPESLAIDAEQDPFAASCYFDVDYFAVPAELPPYVVIQGGLRRRLTGLASSLQKSPLVRMAPDVRYIECSHGTTHLPLADVSGAVLHYKFVGDLRRRVGEAVSRGEHASGALSYQRLRDSLGESDWKGPLLSPHSRRYAGTADLLRHGLIVGSPEWGV